MIQNKRKTQITLQTQITKIVYQIQAALTTLTEILKTTVRQAQTALTILVKTLKTIIHQVQIALITMEGTAVVGVLVILVLDKLLIKPILELNKKVRK
jgi:hypothetical protein